MQNFLVTETYFKFIAQILKDQVTHSKKFRFFSNYSKLSLQYFVQICCKWNEKVEYQFKVHFGIVKAIWQKKYLQTQDLKRYFQWKGTSQRVSRFSLISSFTSSHSCAPLSDRYPLISIIWFKIFCSISFLLTFWKRTFMDN